MRTYAELARMGFRRHAAYRTATYAGIFTNSVFGVIRSAILIAVFRSRTDIAGYDLADALTFTWLTQGLIMVIQMWGWDEIATRVRTGDIAVDLCRPVDYHGQHLAQDLGRAAYQLAARGVAPFLVGLLLYDLRLAADVAAWLGFAVSLVLAVGVSFGLRFLAGLAAFWLLDARGVRMVYSLLVNFFSGFIVPIAFFPGWLETVARLTPFPALVNTPLEIFLGRVHGLDLVGALAVQAGWAALLFVLGRRVLAAGTRKLVVQGG